MHTPSLLHRYQGCLVGLAVGDALGHPAEFLSLSTLRQRFGPQGVTGFESAGSHPPGTYTDDTQMSLALARALLESGDDPERLYDTIAREFVAWSRSPENNRAPGNACMTGCRRLGQGVPPLQAGVEGSKGCGSVMRVAPVALRYHGDRSRLLEVAWKQGRLTHRHPAADAACRAGALLVDLALSSVPPSRWLGEVAAAAEGVSEEFEAKMQQVPRALEREPDEAYALLGEGWVAEEALAGALYAFLRSPEDYRRTVLTAANTQGDSDSIACIAGALSGAYNGLQAIPQAWREQVEGSAELQAVASSLHEARARES